MFATEVAEGYMLRIDTVYVNDVYDSLYVNVTSFNGVVKQFLDGSECIVATVEKQ